MIAMAADSAPAVVDQRPGCVFAPALLIAPETMVEPEGDAQTGHVAAGLVLLPVEPPEIDTLPFKGVKDRIKVGFRPFFL